MSEMINPYCSPKKLGLAMFTLQKDPDYDFNIIAFWTPGGGVVYSATDSGCSCPSPFEDYEYADLKEFQQAMERVESFSTAKEKISTWKENIYDLIDRPKIGDLQELKKMFVPDALLIGQTRYLKFN